LSIVHVIKLYFFNKKNVYPLRFETTTLTILLNENHKEN